MHAVLAADLAHVCRVTLVGFGALAPSNKISGGKVLSSRTRRTSNRASALLRLAAVTVGRTETAVGAFYRRLAARVGKAKAVTATARKIAVLFYNTLRHGMDYADPGASYYEDRYRRRVLTNLQRRGQVARLRSAGHRTCSGQHGSFLGKPRPGLPGRPARYRPALPVHERKPGLHASSRQTYGAPRVHADLRAGGERHGRKRIARLMRDAGLVGACHRRGGPTTTQRDKEARPAPDLVDRNFTASQPNQLWIADITYLPTAAGFLYLAVVLDVWSRKPDAERQSEVVGWSMANHLRAELVLDALEMAAGQRRPKDVVHHSDQGSQPRFNRSSQRPCGPLAGARQNASAGVFQPRVLRGLVLSASATASRASVLWALRSVPFGKYCRSSPLVFSFVPRCHGLCGSQK